MAVSEPATTVICPSPDIEKVPNADVVPNPVTEMF